MNEFNLKSILGNAELWFAMVFLLSLFAWNTSILAVIGLLMWIPVIYKLLKKECPPIAVLQQSDLKLVMLLLAYAGVSLLWSFGDWLLVSKEVVRVLICIAMLLLFISSSFSKNTIDIPLVMLVGGSLVGIVLLMDPVSELIASSRVIDAGIWQAKIAGMGIFYHYEPVAWLFSMLLIFGFSKIVAGHPNLKAVAVFSMVVCVLVLLFAQSRASYLGILVGYLFLLSRHKGKERLWMLGAGVGVCIIHFLIGASLSISFLDVLGREPPFSRSEIWQQGIDLISNAQFFGYGFAASSVLKPIEGLDVPPQHLHNAYLSVLYYGGITGLLIFGSLILSTLANNFSKPYNRPWYAVFLLGLTIFIYDGNHVITYPSAELYLFMLPVLVMASNRLREVKNLQSDKLSVLNRSDLDRNGLAEV